MDEQDCESDIRQHVRERIRSITLRGDRTLNADNAIRRLNELLPGLSRREKADLLQDLDTGQLSRREFLKILGVGTGMGAVAALGLEPVLTRSIGTTPTGRQTSSYETITVNAGENRVYDLSAGETFENVLVDQTADGASFTIRSRGHEGWVVRNVGFKGIGHGQFGTSSGPQMQLGGSGTVENIYMNGKGDENTEGSPMGGIKARESHSGHIDIRHTWVEGYGNNASYFSSQGQRGGGGGTVTYENCYHRDNTVSQYRIGTGGSEVRNCVGIVDDPGGHRGRYSNGSQTARCVWGWHDSGLQITNSSFVLSPDDVKPGNVFMARNHAEDSPQGREVVLNVTDCYVNEDNPQLTVEREDGGPATVNIDNLQHEPTVNVIAEGVPSSPEMAARGEREMPPAIGDETVQSGGATSSGSAAGGGGNSGIGGSDGLC